MDDDQKRMLADTDTDRGEPSSQAVADPESA